MNQPTKFEKQLFADIVKLIEESKQQLAQTANSTLTYLYWRVGKRVNEDFLAEKRAAYGQRIIATLSDGLVQRYGNNFSEKNLRRMMQFASVFSDEQIVVSAIRQLSWTHFIALIPLKSELQREFYLELCKAEAWNVKTLRDKINSMLYERTAISKQPDELIKQELQALREENKMSPDLIFRDPYPLDFLNLKDTYSERHLEDAILRELERFILELGQGFSFVERQKRMIIDGEDFKLDLLFYHRKLKRLIAVELKLGRFKAAYKGQMELYLRWLERYEMEEGENTPLGLILCAEGNHEQVELLQLDRVGIKVSEYLTQLPSKKLLKEKLHQAIEVSKKHIENKLKQEDKS
ncbi:PDDEXK nuclease domain-containing protein [Parapedobacter tibetensis]|uniref:PDDEXK nuclease domain-containing protein n=1 Tax=Parapedobacter tibetensis TaxID=2972951 RepID=UPI00214DDC27|nr:PDDEXK nuclease domain-containing protein [Parapedobacter tibetensis]